VRGNEFLDKIELVDPAYVEAADAKPTGKKRSWHKWAAAAACLCLMIAAIPFFVQAPSTPLDGAGTEGWGPPHIVLDGRKFFISAHLSVSNELPDGFAAAGTTDVVGGFENCPYYLNPDVPEWIYVYHDPDVPEWIYVYHEVRTNGRVDETGTLISTPPYKAYARYVDERLRDKDLVCYNGNYYISMWSVSYSGDCPDVTEEYHDEMYSRYGRRMEGPVPDGFAFAGTAVSTGDDTIPEGRLAHNAGEAEVYYSTDDPDVVLVKTHWFTAPVEENGGEIRHDGFNVYIRYDCPFKPEGK